MRHMSGGRVRIELLEVRSMLATLLPGFTETTVATGFSGPTAMEFSPDGRLWVIEQAGRVKLVRTDGTTFTALTKTVDSAGERGLLGIAFDPNFASNKFVYLYYTNPNAGAASWAGGVHNQLSRFTVNDTNPLQPTLTNEAPILDWNSLSSATNHNGGAIAFGADGMLYANSGDNVQNFTAPDGNSYRVSQSMNTLLGKQLRIDVSKFNSGIATRNDTTVGRLIPSDNPFVGSATGINQLIYTLGLRNPFSFAIQPGTGRMLVNDVGETRWEEIHESVPGANFGWRGGNSDGFNQPPPSFAAGTYHEPLLAYAHSGSGSLATGAAIVGSTFYNPTTVQFPSSYVGKYFYQDLSSGWIRYFNPNTPNTAASPDGNSVAFASNTAGGLRDLEVDAVGNLLYLSGATGSIRRISYQAPVISGQPADRTVSQGQTATFTVTATGPSLNYQWQRLVSGNWTNVGTNSATLSISNSQPANAGSYRVIVSNTFGTVTSNTASLTVNVTSTAPTITTQPVSQQVNVGAAVSLSVVASGTAPLSYQWQKLVGSNWTNVGTNSATFAIAAAAVSNAGSYRVVVTNSAGSATSNTATLSVNQLPVATIASPAVGTKYNWGQTVSFAGSAVDAEDGTLAASRLNWEILFFHQTLPDGTGLHSHPFQTFAGVANGSINVSFAETSPYVWYRFILTATDSQGATSTKSVDINPNLGSFTVQSNPAGLQLLLDGGPIASGTTITGTVGQPRTIGVVSPQTIGSTNYTFSSWSDGGAASHTITIPATSATFSANFVAQGVAPVASVTGPATVTRGQAQTFTLSATHPTATQFSYAINWGDGSAVQTVSGPAGLQVAHTFGSVGARTISVTATAGGQTSAPATANVTVSAVQRVTNTQSGLADLVWTGTSGVDQVTFVQVSATSVRVTTLRENGVATNFVETWTGITGQVQGTGGAGNDTLDASGLTTTRALLDGGAGNNTLYGGGASDTLIGGGNVGTKVNGPEGQQGNNIVVGGAGADTIYGNSVNGAEGRGGNNILLGGAGNDTIYGNWANGGSGGGRNIIVGGADSDTLYDYKLADGAEGKGSILIAGNTSLSVPDLSLVMAEWSSNHAYATRVAKILSEAGGLNGNVHLQPGSNVTSDFIANHLWGTTQGTGLNWFLYRPGRDDVNRAKAGETHTTV
jgi:glucose/arabinose dehydrogenase